MKQPKCKYCKQPFTKYRPLQIVCGMECAIDLKKQEREKIARKELAEGRLKLKSLTAWLNEAQTVFNRWIRVRDGNFCISCQKPINGQTHAGHLRTTKAASQLRFNEDNVHSQCATCNNHLSGNITEYRINLVKKIGVDRVEALENNNKIHRYTIEEAKSIIFEYKNRLKSAKHLEES